MVELNKGAIELAAAIDACDAHGGPAKRAMLAGKLHVAPSYLIKLVRGERKPGRVVALRMLEVTGIPLDAWDKPEVDEPEEAPEGAA